MRLSQSWPSSIPSLFWLLVQAKQVARCCRAFVPFRVRHGKRVFVFLERNEFKRSQSVAPQAHSIPLNRVAEIMHHLMSVRDGAIRATGAPIQQGGGECPCRRTCQSTPPQTLHPASHDTGRFFSVLLCSSFFYPPPSARLPSPGPPLRLTAQNFALFFLHLPRHNFHSFFPVLGVFSKNFGGVFEFLDTCRVKPPRLHTTQTWTFEGPRAKIPREHHQEREERKTNVAGEGKKREMLGSPPFGPHFFCVFWAPTLLSPLPLGTSHPSATL